MGLCDSYSGIVLNQNAATTGQYAWRDTYNGNWIYQTFTLPAGYERGGQTIPDLSGFQILVGVDAQYAAAASLDYVLAYYEGNNAGWHTLTNGTVIGAHADGTAVWFDVVFDKSVPVSANMLGGQFRFGVQTRVPMINAAFNEPVTIAPNGNYLVGTQGFSVKLTDGVPYEITVGGLPAFLLSERGEVTYTVQQGISKAWYVSPSPLQGHGTSLGQAYQADTVTPLLGTGTTASLNFRILGLVADSGTDFLGNEYRSAVIQASPGNTSTTDGIAPVQGSGQSVYYMSPPQPSRFSVVNLYSDMRKFPSTPQYGVINMIGNPNFEYDVVGNFPLWWKPYGSGGNVNDRTVAAFPVFSPTIPATGSQSLHMWFTFTGANQQQGIQSDPQPIASTLGGIPTPLAISMNYYLRTATQCDFYFSLRFYDANMNTLAPPHGVENLNIAATGINTFTATTTVPANAAFVSYVINATSVAAGSLDAYIDAIQVTTTSTNYPYFDGDQPGYQWTAQRGQSPSAQVIDPKISDDTVVLDGVLVDPVTPNMAFNVYYSSDDTNQSDNMSEADWEGKLWTRVPQVYLATQRQQYVFPQPITCKYTKIEFTNLPARAYDPGPFQKPVAYKKFPTWVANYFLGQMEMPSFAANQVNVQYDALSFAYNYYLDDLDQSPKTPSVPPADITAQLTNYFNTTPTGLDPTTLSQINLVMKPYQSPITSQADSTTSLGSYVSQSLGSVVPLPTEGGTLPSVDLSTVSSLAREPVVLEQSLPVMYFFLTCRHAYKELVANFEYNRAYFCGVNAMAFMRHDYTVAADTPQYIESGGDAAHIQSTDFVVDDDGNWYTY